MKKVELKRRAEAVATQRQELMIPLMQHRRFSETVAIDHRAKPQEMQVNIDPYSFLWLKFIKNSNSRTLEVPKQQYKMTKDNEAFWDTFSLINQSQCTVLDINV